MQTNRAAKRNNCYDLAGVAKHDGEANYGVANVNAGLWHKDRCMEEKLLIWLAKGNSLSIYIL
jgi:hypothetical protein